MSTVDSLGVRDQLGALAATGSTGALDLVGPPGGTIYLRDGRVSYAECPLVNGVGELLTRSGRLTEAAWASAVATGRTGEILIERKALSAAGLELAVLSALFGAIMFQLDTAPETRFEREIGPSVGAVQAIGLDQVCVEVERRRRLLRDAWPDDTVDTTPVGPVPRLRGHHVVLTAPQWAIVASADRVLTPLDLARQLGGDPFALLLEARRLIRAGLLEPCAPVQPAEPLPRRTPRPFPHPGRDAPTVPIGILHRVRQGLEDSARPAYD